MEPKMARRLDTINQVAPQCGPSRVACNANGTILTLRGEVSVSDLRVGEKVITRDTGTTALSGLYFERRVCDAVLIKAGSLGHMRPSEDAIVPADAQVLLRDWRAKAFNGNAQAFAKASALCDGESVSLLPHHELDVATLTFERGHIVYVAGLELSGSPAP